MGGLLTGVYCCATKNMRQLSRSTHRGRSVGKCADGASGLQARLGELSYNEVLVELVYYIALKRRWGEQGA